MLSALVIFICIVVLTIKTTLEYIVRFNQNNIFKPFLKINTIERLILSDSKTYYKATVWYSDKIDIKITIWNGQK